MTTNLLVAIRNLVQNPIKDVLTHYQRGTNRINLVGDALEIYVKDLFCNVSNVSELSAKNETYPQYLSYIGNQNNPPDFMIRGGDAVEVKKTGSTTSLPLNSS